MTPKKIENEERMPGQLDTPLMPADGLSQLSTIVLIDLGLSGLDGWDGYRRGADLINAQDF